MVTLPGVFLQYRLTIQGLLIGTFSNGVKKTIGAVEIALFQNPAGLESYWK